MRTLVLGLGNTLLGDDGVGVHVVRSLQKGSCDVRDVTFVDGGTLSFTLASYIDEADSLILIDAAQLNSLPGEISVYEGDSMDRFVSGNRNKSVHEVNITDILALSHLMGQLPQRRALIGIQPLAIGWSDSLSEPVAKAVAEACRLTHRLIGSWRQQN